jgi:hypothetical protein
MRLVPPPAHESPLPMPQYSGCEWPILLLCPRPGAPYRNRSLGTPGGPAWRSCTGDTAPDARPLACSGPISCPAWIWSVFLLEAHPCLQLFLLEISGLCWPGFGCLPKKPLQRPPPRVHTTVFTLTFVHVLVHSAHLANAHAKGVTEWLHRFGGNQPLP